MTAELVRGQNHPLSQVRLEIRISAGKPVVATAVLGDESGRIHGVEWVAHPGVPTLPGLEVSRQAAAGAIAERRKREGGRPDNTRMATSSEKQHAPGSSCGSADFSARQICSWARKSSRTLVMMGICRRHSPTVKHPSRTAAPTITSLGWQWSSRYWSSQAASGRPSAKKMRL